MCSSKTKFILQFKFAALAILAFSTLTANATYSDQMGKLKQTRKLTREVLAEIFNQNRKIKILSKQIDTFEDQLESTRLKLSKVEADLITKESEIAKLKQEIIKRLRKIKQDKENISLVALFTNTSAESTERKIKQSELLSQVEVDLIKKLDKAIIEKKQIANEIETNSKEFEEKINTLSENKDKLAVHIKQKNSLLKLLNQKEATSLELIKKYDQFGFSFESQKGKLLPPISLQTSSQAASDSPESNLETSDTSSSKTTKDKIQIASNILGKKGLFFKSPENSSVNSIADGKVVFAEKIKSLGQTLIIDHGDNFYSVYAGITDQGVKKNDMVSKNQKIAQTGNIKLFNQSGLYFEIRRFSQSESPIEWLKGIN